METPRVGLWPFLSPPTARMEGAPPAKPRSPYLFMCLRVISFLEGTLAEQAITHALVVLGLPDHCPVISLSPQPVV